MEIRVHPLEIWDRFPTHGKTRRGGAAGLGVGGHHIWGELLVGSRDRTGQVTHLGQDCEHEAFAAIPENLQRIAGSIRVVSGKQVDAATEFFQFRSIERASDGNWVKWEGRRHPGVPCNETFRAHSVWWGVGCVICIAHWQAPWPATHRGGVCVIAGLVIGAMGHLFTRQSGEPQKYLIRGKQGVRGFDG